MGAADIRGTFRGWDYTVEECYDSPEFVWSVLDDNNNVICDGYTITQKDGVAAAKQAIKEHIEWMEGN